MTPKLIQNYRRRIQHANRSFAIYTDMLLSYEIDAMTHAERVELANALRNSKKPLSYRYLDRAIANQFQADFGKVS